MPIAIGLGLDEAPPLYFLDFEDLICIVAVHWKDAP